MPCDPSLPSADSLPDARSSRPFRLWFFWSGITKTRGLEGGGGSLNFRHLPWEGYGYFMEQHIHPNGIDLHCTGFVCSVHMLHDLLYGRSLSGVQ